MYLHENINGMKIPTIPLVDIGTSPNAVDEKRGHKSNRTAFSNGGPIKMVRFRPPQNEIPVPDGPSTIAARARDRESAGLHLWQPIAAP